MSITKQISAHFRKVHFGGNWTGSNLKDVLQDVTFEQATTKVYDLNTIYALTFHINYYIAAMLKVLQGEPLQAKDAYSYDHPEISSQEEWEAFVTKVFNDAELFAEAVAQLSEDSLSKSFADEKYGNFYRNLTGVIEHTHYHLGQIALLKKIVAQR